MEEKAGLTEGRAASRTGFRVGTGQFFNLQIPLGKLALTFTLVAAQNGFPAFYQFSKGSFALTTVSDSALMATGLAGIIGMIRRKRKRGKLEFMPKQSK
jgi:hypothetical protein